MKVVISQPRYLPILSYLQRMHFADVFVLLDTVQRQSRGWENRNKLLLPEPAWLSIPVTGSSRTLICESHVNGLHWVDEHKHRIKASYSKHPFYSEEILDCVYVGLDEYHNQEHPRFVDVTNKMLMNLAELLSIEYRFVLASELDCPAEVDAKGVGKLVALSKCVNADLYISGKNGREYGVVEAFAGQGIDIMFHDFKDHEYEQYRNRPFVPYMACLDALFCIGTDEVRRLIRRKPELTE